MENQLHICVAFDQNYVRHFFALFASIFANNRHNRITAHCIITGLSSEQKEGIKAYAQANKAEILFYEIDEAFLKTYVVSNHWSAAIYYRLFFPLMVPAEVTKLLYVDTDIVCVNDLAPLFNTPLNGYPVGAIYDKGVKTAPRIGITEEGNYFNSGVLLINVPVWNEQKISEQVLQFVADHAETIIYPDQDGLNAVLKGRWKKLDWRYNVMHMYIPEAMSGKEKRAFLADKVLLHYTLDRPWKMLCQSQFRGLYHKYLRQSPFEVKDKYVDYSIKKIPHFLKIRAAEMYFNMPLVKKLWRSVRQRH